MMKKFIYLLSAVLIIGSSAKAQDACGTDEMLRKMKQQYPAIEKYEKILDEQMRKQSQLLDLNNSQLKTTGFGPNDTLHIPIVFHIVHDYGNNNYVTDDKIYALVDYINKIYLAKNTGDLNSVIPTFQPYIGNAKIQFHLATKDPQGNPTKGITHNWSHLTYGGNNQAKFDLWAPDSYVNIWLIDFIFDDNPNDGTILAYATPPASGAAAPWYDGVIGNMSRSTQLGPNTDYTIPHELGHVLNLAHTWGNTNSPGVSCGDDDVDDTPPTMGQLGGCSVYDTTCTNVVVPFGKIILDSTKRIVDSVDGSAITLTVKTGLTLENLDIYPIRLGEGFDIALLHGTDTLQTIARFETVGDDTTDVATKTDTYNSKQNAGINFNAANDVRIETVTVFPSVVGEPFTILLTNGSDTLDTYIDTTRTNSGPQVVPVGFYVPKKTNYWIYLSRNPGMKHDMSTATVDNTPVNSGVVINYHRDTNSGPNQGYYNFLYSWNLRYKGISDTDKTLANGARAPYKVPLNWRLAPSATPYKIVLTENNGLSHDSVPTITYNTSVQCVVDMTNERTNNLMYNYMYNLSIRYGYIKAAGSVCNDYPDTVNAQNIMNYSDCKYMFTKGQVERMRNALANPVGHRDNLVTQQNAIKTGILNPNTGKYGEMIDLPPVADFSVEKGLSGDRTYYLCADNNTEFKFRDRSWGDTVQTVKWEFSNGADPATATTANNAGINVKFSQPGWVTIKLTATGNNTGDATVERTNVYAADPNFKIPAIGFFQEFKNEGNDLDKWPSFNYYNNFTKWEQSPNVGYYDDKSLVFTGFDDRGANAAVGSPQGDFDDFFTPAYDLSGLPADASLNFMYAGCYRTAFPEFMRDTLEIHYSIDCGSQWTLLKRMANEELSTKGTYHNRFAPLWQGDWKQASITIPGHVRGDRVFFRFRYKPGVGNDWLSTGTGNNFYIDRININEFPAGISTLLPDNKDVVLAPNPTASGSSVIIRNAGGSAKSATVTVTDITGKVVYSVQQSLKNQIERIEIPATAVPVKGVYLVQISADERTYTEKLVVY